jgi:glycosyltransferase involved in cell wall biosynthesis
MLAKSKAASTRSSSIYPSRPKVALLPWGDVWEDFFDSIGVDFDAFCREMTGGWQFGYIEALKQQGVDTVLFYASTRVTEVTYYQHEPTGASICLLPVPAVYRKVRRRMVHPYPSFAYSDDVKALFGEARGGRRLLFRALQYLAPALSFPLWSLVREMRRTNCQAILCQEYEYARFDLMVGLGKLLRLPVFASFQGGNYDGSFGAKLLRATSIRSCQGLAIGTQSEIERVRRKYRIKPYKVAKIYNPIDLRLWELTDRAQARAALDIPITAKVVVWHGRISLHTKGLDILLEAWKAICQCSPGQDLRLMLMGTGRDAKQLQQCIDALPQQNILWVNEYVNDRAAICKFLSAGDVYAFPSRREGFPVAPIEAMACGLPVVAADAPGVPDIFEEGEQSGGIVVPRDNTDAFRLALESLLSDTERARRMGKVARRRVEQYFSLESVGLQLKQLLLPQR